MIYRTMAFMPIALSVSLYASEPTKEPTKVPWYEQPDSVLAVNINDEGISDLEMKMAYDGASKQVKGIVNHLKNPKCYNKSGFRTALFYGEPGTGKTTMAHAIAKYANWDCKPKRPSDFQKGNRGDAAQNFRTFIEEIGASNAETVIIIDEANGLWENSESKNHDTAETGREVWQWIGKLRKYPKVFMILIANRIHQMTPQFKNRLIDYQYEFTMPISTDDRLKLFTTMLKTYDMTLNPDHGVKEMTDVLTKNPKWTTRDYDGFIFRIQAYCRDELDKAPTGQIGDKVIAAVAKERAKREKDIQYYDKELSDTDRQDLYQMQNMWSNILMQRLQKFSILGRTPGITRATGNYIMDKISTQNQQRVMSELIDVSELKKEHVFTDLA